jgi:ADP-heptose:LPS heptosyltransferase
MRDHPALAHKYHLVPYTRGAGIEVGGGHLYPHFRAPGEREAVGSLDFVFVVNQDLQAWPELVKPGGHVVHLQDDVLTICTKQADGALAPVDRTLKAAPGRDKLACVVRYGGFGDMIQASSVLPALREQGYTVYVMTTPRGQEILANDPHVDGFLLQDTDQVPNEELGGYWEVQARRFDRFINLSESIEGTLLAYPGRTNHGWPHAIRCRELDKNYFEWTADLAGVPFEPAARFYPTDAEREWATTWLADFKHRAVLGRAARPMEYVPTRFNILWTLAGSSVHKMYPHQDKVLQAVLNTFPEAVVTLCGDAFCRMLEAGWEKHPRVRCTSGELSIRQTMALAQLMDCVVGPETGVLNAVGFEPMAKVVMLSHSSANNLTKHWVNATAVTPSGTDCYPCHQLHTDRRHCPEHEPTGASMCAWNTDPRRVYDAIAEAYMAWRDNPVRRVLQAAATPERMEATA